jgi:TonB family protein
MPRDLFGDVTRPSISIGNRKWYTLPLSLFSHSAIVLVIVAIPILAPAVMPSVFADDDMTLITTILPPTPLPPRLKQPEPNDPLPVDPSVAPVNAPTGFAKEPELLRDPAGDSPAGIIVGGIDTNSAVLAPPPVIEAPPPGPVRVGGSVRPPVKTRHVDPVYPQIALMSRVQGIVIIEATLGADGRVLDARVLRSEPLLKQAALDAVSQWQFTPTLLNGVPVPVIMTVSVIFTLK